MRRLMKRNCFWLSLLAGLLIVFLFVSSSAQAAATTANASQVRGVQSLESALFAVNYDQESIETRLNRLEQTIFGQVQSGSVDARLSKLQKVLSPSSLGPLSPTAKPMEQASTAGKGPVQPPPAKNGDPIGSPPASADATDYPTVTQMEIKVFGKDFVREDITARLVRLEKQVFKNMQKGSLADRVDNLRLVVLGDVPSAGPPNIGAYAPQPYPTPPQFPYPPSGYSQPYAAPPDYAAYPVDPMAGGMGGFGDPMNGAPTPDMLAAIGEVEKEVIGQQFSTEPFEARLDRLENKIFHATSPEMPLEDRMQRITAVASAGGAPESPKTKTKHTIQALLPFILTILPLVLL